MKSIFKSILTLSLILSVAPIAMAESQAVKGAKADYSTFKKEMTAKLEVVDQQLTELKEKAKTKGSNVSDKTVRELEETRTSLRTRLDELKEGSQSGWANMKANIAKSVDDLNKKVQEAMK